MVTEGFSTILEEIHHRPARNTNFLRTYPFLSLLSEDLCVSEQLCQVRSSLPGLTYLSFPLTHLPTFLLLSFLFSDYGGSFYISLDLRLNEVKILFIRIGMEGQDKSSGPVEVPLSDFPRPGLDDCENTSVRSR